MTTVNRELLQVRQLIRHLKRQRQASLQNLVSAYLAFRVTNSRMTAEGESYSLSCILTALGGLQQMDAVLDKLAERRLELSRQVASAAVAARVVPADVLTTVKDRDGHLVAASFGWGDW